MKLSSIFGVINASGEHFTKVSSEQNRQKPLLSQSLHASGPIYFCYVAVSGKMGSSGQLAAHI